MLNNGVGVLVASKKLGHLKPIITLDVYVHLLDSQQDKVGLKMESFISP